MDAGHPRRTDLVDYETLALPVGYTRIEGRSDDASAGVQPRLGDHLRTGRPSPCSTSCLPLAGSFSLARDSHVAFGRRLRRCCRYVLLGVLAPLVMARSALPGHDGMDRRQVRPGEVLRGNGEQGTAEGLIGNEAAAPALHTHSGLASSSCPF